MRHKIASVGSSAFLLLALAVFMLPFMSVSCDIPGGYGRAAPGGTSEYSGFDLATGSAPSVDTDHLRPVDEQQSDELGVQPILALAAIALAVALALSLTRSRLRRFSAVLGTGAVILLTLGEWIARGQLIDNVAAQQREPFLAGESAADFVDVGLGFLASLVFATVGTALALFATRSRPTVEPDD